MDELQQPVLPESTSKVSYKKWIWGIGLLVVVLLLMGIFGRYLGANLLGGFGGNTSSPAQPASDINGGETEIVTNQIAFRATAKQALEARDFLDRQEVNDTPTSSPSVLAATDGPQPSPGLETTPFPSSEPTSAALPSPELATPIQTSGATIEPTPFYSVSPTESGSPSDFPVNTDEPTSTPVNSQAPADIVDVFPELASIKDQIQTVTSVTSSSSQGGGSQQLSALDRWFVITLSTEKKIVHVNNTRDLVPIGKPILSREEPKKEDLFKSEEQAAVSQKREAVTADEIAAVAEFKALLSVVEAAEFEKVEPVSIARISSIPNDPFFTSSSSWQQPYDDLWGMKRIQAPAAWDVTTGSSNTLIAELDTGLDMTHPDIQGNIAFNNGEMGVDSQGRDKKTNQVDDDNNGYKDDWQGWDYSSHDNDPTDDNGHGTHVAGTIAAKGNNGQGVVGVMWQAQILPIKFMGPDGSGYVTDAAAGLKYAADRGAKVINNSWGGSGQSALIDDAIDYASAKGSLLVAAAGNSSCNLAVCPMIPASNPKVIAVSALTPLDRQSVFSNYGSKIELTAPGGSLLSYEGGGILSLRPANVAPLGEELGSLMRLSGTSMAAPHVSGVAGLVFALHPDWTAEQVRQQLQATAQDLGLPGRDQYYGFGVVNAAKAVGASSVDLAVTYPLYPDDYFQQVRPNQFTEVRGTVAGSAFRGYRLEMHDDEYFDNLSTPWNLVKESTQSVTAGILGRAAVPTTFSDIARSTYFARLMRVTVNGDKADRIQVFRPHLYNKNFSVFINDDAPEVNTPFVMLRVWGVSTSSSIPSQVRFRNAGAEWGPWEAYAELKPWMLSSGLGEKKVEIQVKYSSSSSAPFIQDAFDTITLLPSPLQVNTTRAGAVEPGAEVTYTMNVKNVSNTTLVGVAPAAFFVSSTSSTHIEPPYTFLRAEITGGNSGCAYDSAQKVVGCNLQNIEPGEQKVVKLIYKIPITAQCGSEAIMENGVGVTGVNMGISVKTPSTVKCPIELSTVAAGTMKRGEQMTYTLTVKNNSATTAVGVAPAGFFVTAQSGAHIEPPYTYVGASVVGANSGCTYDSVQKAVGCNLQNIEPGQQKVVTMTFTIPSDAVCGQTSIFATGVAVTGVNTGLSVKTQTTVACE